jgi:hypothetical protein
LRGFAVALVACGPVFAFAAPAIGEDTTSVADPPPDTTTTVPGPSPLENPPPATTTTPSTETPTDVTDPTVPTTDPTVPTTDTTLPTTADTTTDTTTATSTPSSTVDAWNPGVGPGSDEPPSSSGTSGSDAATATDTAQSPKAAPTDHDASLPLKELVQPIWGSPLSAPLATPGALAAKPAVSLKPVTDAAKTIGEAVTGALRAPWSPDNASSSWGDLGSAAPRFGPWIVLLAMAWLVRTVIASILADRTAGPRRRRWTLL